RGDGDRPGLEVWLDLRHQQLLPVSICPQFQVAVCSPWRTSPELKTPDRLSSGPLREKSRLTVPPPSPPPIASCLPSSRNCTHPSPTGVLSGSTDFGWGRKASSSLLVTRSHNFTVSSWLAVARISSPNETESTASV